MTKKSPHRKKRARDGWWICEEHDSSFYYMITKGFERAEDRHYHNNKGETLMKLREVLVKGRRE